LRRSLHISARNRSLRELNGPMTRDREWRRRALLAARLLVVVGPGRGGRPPQEGAAAALAGGAGFLAPRLQRRPKGEVFGGARRPEAVPAILPCLGALPGYAIGGIDAGNVAAVLATGVHGVAVGSAIVQAEDVEAATRNMLAAMGKK